MQRAITPYHLGATLYLPATHKNLYGVSIESKYPQAKSIIIDFEDAIFDADFKVATAEFEKLLADIPNQDLLIFVRPRCVKHLKKLLKLKHIDKLDGFVLAKCDTKNMKNYFNLLLHKAFWVMPVLESVEVFDTAKLKKIKSYFLKQKKKILTLRFGGEDLSSSLGLKRQCEDILYDFYPMTQLLSSLVLMFKNSDFNLTAAVFTCFKNSEGYIKEVEQDLKMGLFGKTVIHPSQIALAHELYKVSPTELNQANLVLDKDAKAIMASEGQMLETIPHRRWAKGIKIRESLYGVC